MPSLRKNLDKLEIYYVHGKATEACKILKRERKTCNEVIKILLEKVHLDLGLKLYVECRDIEKKGNGIPGKGRCVSKISKVGMNITL